MFGDLKTERNGGNHAPRSLLDIEASNETEQNKAKEGRRRPCADRFRASEVRLHHLHVRLELAHRRGNKLPRESLKSDSAIAYRWEKEKGEGAIVMSRESRA